MININNPDHFAEVMQFALNNQCADKLIKQLNTLANFGGKPDYSTCYLYADFASNSFAFNIQKEGKNWMNGGLIYSGPGQPLDGSAPAFTVGIGIDSSEHGWSIHT